MDKLSQMDLFVVDRYMGEGELSQKAPTNQSTRLNLLKEHIARRKRKLDLSRTDTHAKDTNEESPRKDKKRKKGGKESKEGLVKEESTGEGEISSETHDSTKKKNKNKKSTKLSKNDSEQKDNTDIVDDAIEEPAVIAENNVRENPPKNLSFTIIGVPKKKTERKKVEKSLPDWLAKPQIIDTDLNSNLLPINKLDGLSKHIQSRLHELKINSFFPIQTAVIPCILSQIQPGSLHGLGGYRPSDICVSAPTGSGKTLAYVIPIVQALAKQPVCILQALVLLPTKDLACQVKQVFETFVQGTGLKVGLASGNKSLAREQSVLVGQGYGSFSHVNILVATPGRLVDHLSSTQHFTLQHLRFLVIDEADRLLDQSYHDWLNKVLGASYEHQNERPDPRDNLFSATSLLPTFNLRTTRELQVPLTPARFAKLQLPLQKLLFSATMTHSPEKLAPLQLHDPILYIASKPPDTGTKSISDSPTFSRFNVPHELSEFMVVCNSGEKPLMLLHLLTQKKLTGVLCFTSSLEATHRLYLLVHLFGGIEVAEYSSSLNAQQRHGILRDFRQGAIQLLICSDAMARGMDIDNVSYVISYDAPKYVKTYIHRVGRTARAGNQGTAYTLLHSEQVHHFKELIQKTGRDKIPKHAVKDDELQPLVDKYQGTLKKLEEIVKKERLPQEHGFRKGQDEVDQYLKKQLMANMKS